MPIKMNGHVCTVYSMLSRVCDLFFPIMYEFCVISFDEDVLILPGAVSTPVDDGPYFFNDGSWLVNLPTMVYLSDWRESFHFISFVPVSLFQFFQWKLSSSVHQKYVFWSNNILCECLEHWCVQYLSQTCIHAMLDSNSICSEGSALQCIFIFNIVVKNNYIVLSANLCLLLLDISITAGNIFNTMQVVQGTN